MSTARPPASPTSLSTAHAPALDLPFAFMILAVVGLAVVAAVAPWALPLLLEGFAAPSLLAFVHLNTVGVIGAIVIGASYQLVPVVLQVALASVRLGRVSFWCYLAGAVSFVPGLLYGWRPGLVAGSLLLTLAFGLYIGIVAWTIWRAPVRDVVAAHVVLALVSLALAVTVGLLLAWNRSTGFLGGLTAPLLATHVVLMLAGWVAVLLSGVAYRLVGMFTLTEDQLRHRWAWLALLAAVAGTWTLAGGLLLRLDRWVLAAGALALLVGQALYLVQLVHLYRVRRRRALDVHIPFALASAVSGVVSVGLVVGGLVLAAGVSSPVWVAAVWLAIGGLAETAIQGFFYKIAPFLLWLHRYAPLAGRQKVPLLEQMYWRRLALAGWVLWSLGLLLALAALAAASTALARAAGLAVSLGLVCFLVNVVLIGSHGVTTPAGRTTIAAWLRRPGILLHRG